jgi:hypothetical protein
MYIDPGEAMMELWDRQILQAEVNVFLGFSDAFPRG